jgi:hypothetical protein
MSLYTENEEKWKQLIEIDYFTHFVKAWVAFNAWYKNHFPDTNTDREAINQIKNNSNRIKTKFNSLITGTNEESEIFKNNLGQLHYFLLNNEIKNNDIRIWFESFVVELDRSCLEQRNEIRNIKYYVHITLNRGEISNVLVTVKDSNNNTICNYQHTVYAIEHFRQSNEYANLSPNQQSNIIALFQEANPKKPTNFLTNDENNCINVGQYKFINNQELLFKGLIEILYSLRNVLFHGQIIPDRNTNQVYEPAYKILKMLID